MTSLMAIPGVKAGWRGLAATALALALVLPALFRPEVARSAESRLSERHPARAKAARRTPASRRAKKKSRRSVRAMRPAQKAPALLGRRHPGLELAHHMAGGQVPWR